MGKVYSMDYKYKGIELTPTVFIELLIQFYDGKQFSRQEALEQIPKYHSENGGLLNKANYTSVFKKAVQKLKDNGIENSGYGIWKLCYKKEKVEEILVNSKQDDFTYTADKVIGVGSKSVYVYFYDAYKELATLKGKNIWECKIGRTDVDPIGRIMSQAGTCYPELPHIALLINCDNSSLLEKTIHNILKMKNRWLSNSPGKEWFITSPQEIENIYNTIMSNVVEP